MEQGSKSHHEGLGRILRRLARDDGDTKHAQQVTEPSPHWDDLTAKPAVVRAVVLERALRASLPLADNPKGHCERILAPKSLLLSTTEELLANPSSDHPREAAAVPIALLNAQYEIELRAVRHCAVAARDDTLLATYIEAAMSTLWPLLLAYWRRQLVVPDRFWGELHALYQLACERGIEDHEEALPPALDIRVAYLKPLLLGSLNPTRYRSAELKQIAAFLDTYALRARLGNPSGLLLVDPNSSRPPGYIGKQHTDGCWRLCVRGLVQALDEDAAGQKLLVTRLARDLGRYWTRRQIRGELHRRSVEQTALAVGLETVHKALTGCEDDDCFPDHLSPTARLPTAPRIRHPWVQAVIADQSTTGAQFRLHGTPEQISPGALIAAQHRAGWRLGIVRWTQLTPEFDTAAGVQWLPDGFQPAAVHSLEPDRPTPSVRAFLRPIGSDEQDVELILPVGMFNPADAVHARLADREYLLSLTAVVDLTFHIARCHARRHSGFAH